MSLTTKEVIEALRTRDRIEFSDLRNFLIYSKQRLIILDKEPSAKVAELIMNR